MNRPRFRPQPWTRTSVLMLLPALAAALPVILLLAVHLWSAQREAHAEIERLLRVRVNRLASDAQSAISAAERASRFLARRIEMRAKESDICGRGLAGFGTLHPTWSNAVIASVDGSVMCDSNPRGEHVPGKYSREPWFAQALAGGATVISDVGKADDGAVVVHVASRIGEGPQPLGVAVVEINLAAFTSMLGGEELPAGSSFVVNDRADKVAARYPDPQSWLGTAGAGKRAAFRSAHPDGFGTLAGFDGVERMFLELDLPTPGWHAAIGVPAELAQAPIREALRRSIVALATAIALGAVLAVLLARVISRPLAQLAQTVERVGLGDRTARAPVPDCGEVRTVAKQVNRMLDNQERVERGLRQATSLYEALARANGAVVRGGRFEEIAAEICRACVDSSLALRIAIVVCDGPTPELVATSGANFDDWRGLQAAWKEAYFAEDPLPLPTALRTGQPVIANDYLALRAPAEVVAFARSMGVRALAALPLVLEGRTWGAMLVHGERVDWFDDQRLRLFNAIADDLVHALSNEHREEARAKAERELLARDRQLEGIIESALDAVVAVDGDQRIRVFNAAATRMFGVEAAQALGQPLTRYLPGVRTQEPQGLQQSTALRADGSPFPAEASVARHTAGSEAMVTAFVRDITDAHAAQQARAAQHAAEAANRAKSVFLANVSHELRTPIHAILGFNELALQTELTPQQYSYLQNATLAADSLVATVDQVLDLCNLEAGRFTPAREEFLPRELAEQTRAAIEQTARSRGLAFRIEFDERLPARLLGDRRRLLQVVTSLAGNAVKFTAAGEVVVSFGMQAQEEGRVLLRAAVRDTGIGMNEGEMRRVFEPFEQGDASSARRYGGTGLGLAVSRQLVRLMGGTLDARSTPGAGSEFQFSMWLDVAATPALPAGPAGGGPLRGRSVLVVDDNAVNLELARLILGELASMEVVTACGGAEALRILGGRDFDIVLMDLQMPLMDGYETTRAILARAGAVPPPIVALTAHASDDVRHACLAAGMVDCVGKAGGERALLDAVARTLRREAIA